MRLGEGSGWALSPDEKWVISILVNPPQINLLPTGAGEVKKLPAGSIEEFGLGASWLPNGKKILFIGREHAHGPRTYMQEINAGTPHPVTPDGVTGTLVSPDGKYLVAADEHNQKSMLTLLELYGCIQSFSEMRYIWFDIFLLLILYRMRVI